MTARVRQATEAYLEQEIGKLEAHIDKVQRKVSQLKQLLEYSQAKSSDTSRPALKVDVIALAERASRV